MCETHTSRTDSEQSLAPFSRSAGAGGGGDEGVKSTEQRLKLPAAIQS